MENSIKERKEAKMSEVLKQFVRGHVGRRLAGIVPRARDCFGTDCGIVDPAPHGCVDQVQAVMDLMPADVDYEAEALGAYGLSIRDLRRRPYICEANRVLHMNNHGLWLGQRRYGGPLVKCRQIFALGPSGREQVAEYFGVVIEACDSQTIIVRYRDDSRRIHYRRCGKSPVEFLTGAKITRVSRNQWSVEPYGEN